MKRIIIFSLILALVLSLSSCADTRSAEDVLLDITKDIDALPFGNLYLKSANEGEDAHPTDSLIRSLYHDRATEYEFTLIEDYAIYICSHKPCEVAVYKCYSSSDTDVIAAMCLSRIDKLCVWLEGTPFADIPKNASVRINGRFVSVIMV